MASPPPQCPHGIPYAQACYGCGWTCPACKRSYAPWVRECTYRHDDAKPFNLFGEFDPIPPVPVDEPGTVPATAMRLALPPEWNTEGYQHLARVGSEWREVLPGLQCRAGDFAGFLVKDGSDVIVIRFRLTPADGSS
jgi:hypothetical protein